VQLQSADNVFAIIQFPATFDMDCRPKNVLNQVQLMLFVLTIDDPRYIDALSDYSVQETLDLVMVSGGGMDQKVQIVALVELGE
jgi:hypothetical protein